MSHAPDALCQNRTPQSGGLPQSYILTAHRVPRFFPMIVVKKIYEVNGASVKPGNPRRGRLEVGLDLVEPWEVYLGYEISANPLNSTDHV